MDKHEGLSAPVEVAAIGVSITCNLGGDRQIVMQTHFAGDHGKARSDAVLDEMFGLIDRQKARYDLEKLETEFQTVGRTLANLIDGLPHADRNMRKEKARRKLLLVELTKGRDEKRKEFYDKWSSEGRKGSFTLQGFEKTTIDRMDAEIAKAEESWTKADADEDQNRQSVYASIAHYQQDLRERREAIDRKRALFGGEPETRYLTEEKFETPRPVNDSG